MSKHKKYCPHCNKYMGKHGESAVVSCFGCAYDNMRETREKVQALYAEWARKKQEFTAMWPEWILEKSEKK